MSCLQLSNSSLLDEATAAAEAMTMCSALAQRQEGQVPCLGEVLLLFFQHSLLMTFPAQTMQKGVLA